jgi:hypothetical protein
MTTIHISRVYSGYHVTFRGGDFSLCVSTLKSFIPATLRGYTPATRQWFIDEDATTHMRRWLSYAETMIGARVEWIGGATYGDSESYADYEPECPPPLNTPPPARPKPKAVDPYVTLHLLPSAPPEVVKAAYKALATLHHPDKPGGDGERMRVINAAYRRLAA